MISVKPKSGSKLRILVLTKTGERAGGARTYEAAIIRILREISNEIPAEILVGYPQEVPSVEGPVAVKGVAHYSNSKWSKLRSVLASFPLGRFLSKWFNISPLSRLIKLLQPDLVYFTSTNLHAMAPLNIPSIFTIWDLGHRELQRFPEFSSWSENWLRERLIKRALHQSLVTVTDSEYTGHNLERLYEVQPNQWVSLGMALVCTKSSEEIAEPLPQAYFLYPAQKWAHKNHDVLLEAILEVRKTRPDVQLFLTGSNKAGSERLNRRIGEMASAGIVKDFGYVSDDQTRDLIRNATAITMPTFLGPTNLPPLEAAVLGVRSLVSNVHHFDEQVSEYLTELPPDSPELWARAMLSALDQKPPPPWTADSPAPKKLIQILRSFLIEKLDNPGAK